MEERQKNNVSMAMAKVLVVVYVLVVAFGLLKFLQNFNIMDCIFELIVAIAVPILVLIFSRNKKKKTTFPMSLAGLAIYPDRTKEAKKGRIKAYLLDSFTFSATIAAIQVIFRLWNKFQAGTLDLSTYESVIGYGVLLIWEFALSFVVYFIMDYIMYEHKSKRYCKENSITE